LENSQFRNWEKETIYKGKDAIDTIGETHMKISTKKLQKIVQEEIQTALNEYGVDFSGLEDAFGEEENEEAPEEGTEEGAEEAPARARPAGTGRPDFTKKPRSKKPDFTKKPRGQSEPAMDRAGRDYEAVPLELDPKKSKSRRPNFTKKQRLRLASPEKRKAFKQQQAQVREAYYRDAAEREDGGYLQEKELRKLVADIIKEMQK
tara:strand:- start:12542 stop:13156 length:615 start_codon:yes stop_codon:yes gene_type:complete